ncbi:MAG: polysaccharide deacetylase family protein [Thermodesulfobacteriota bacterium]|nr:polysaccharide deacetylase family protein [Thermodesulfobacteriota bacterium]
MKRLPLSNSERLGIGAIITALPLAFIDFRLAVFPLAIFLVMCVAAPFFPRISFYLPVISRGSSGNQAVALTFDDGPNPKTTPELLRLLKEYGAVATFFVVGEKAAAHPELIREILSQGHSIGNHSYRHDALLLLKSTKTIRNDIEATQSVLKQLGVIALTFRPPAGITAPGLRKALKRSGMVTVNFSCRAFDGGNKRIGNLAKKILGQVRPDDIILLHDVTPKPDSLLPEWVNEVENILRGIKDIGLSIQPLSEVIENPVMIADTNPSAMD